MMTPIFACSEDCDSRNYSMYPDNANRCNCWNAEITRLEGRVAELEGALNTLKPAIKQMYELGNMNEEMSKMLLCMHDACRKALKEAG